MLCNVNKQEYTKYACTTWEKNGKKANVIKELENPMALLFLLAVFALIPQNHLLVTIVTSCYFESICKPWAKNNTEK